jgi:hypothetical protein
MIDLMKYWAKLNTKCAGLIKEFQRLTDRSERMRQANDMSEQIDTIEDQAESFHIKEIPHQVLTTEAPQGFRIWRNIMTRLPDEYDIPNPETVNSLLPMTADYYRNLFANPSPHLHLLVDEQIWMKIKAALPQNYKIPEQETLK